MEDKKSEPAKQERYSLVEVVTQTDIAIKDNESGKVYADKELLLFLVNKLNADVVKL